MEIVPSVPLFSNLCPAIALVCLLFSFFVLFPSFVISILCPYFIIIIVKFFKVGCRKIALTLIIHTTFINNGWHSLALCYMLPILNKENIIIIYCQRGNFFVWSPVTICSISTANQNQRDLCRYIEVLFILIGS